MKRDKMGSWFMWISGETFHTAKEWVEVSQQSVKKNTPSRESMQIVQKPRGRKFLTHSMTLKKATVVVALAGTQK